MKTLAIKRDRKTEFILKLLQQMTWNVPQDFAVSIKKFEINDLSPKSAHGYIRLYPNNPKVIPDSAVMDILNMANVLHTNASIRMENGAMFIKIVINVWEEK